MTKDEALRIVLGALERLNAELESPVPVSADTRLFGPDAVIDSLSLVSIIVDVEADVSDQVGFPVSLTDDRAIQRDSSPFTDPDALADYIVSLLKDRS